MNPIFIASLFLISLHLFCGEGEKKDQRRSIPIFDKGSKCNARLSDSVLCSRRRRSKVIGLPLPPPRIFTQIPCPRDYPPQENFVLPVSTIDQTWKKIDGKRLFTMAKMLKGTPSQNLNIPLNVPANCLKCDEKSLLRAMMAFLAAYKLGHQEAREELVECFNQLQELQQYKDEMLSPQETWTCPHLRRAEEMLAQVTPPFSQFRSHSAGALLARKGF